ncbi:nuclear transport factor 2 family protein [Pedobacter sp. MC2016-15]|uniref:nuclear transport factor 2 family protein n=1 Tax=Pedobacter sp. MC2016-15 TaxID=2994473 RepID=UPI002246E96A|nr:nuclear transport factor 2 family protein [Pedobacter sp. MC2016-15]MCX2480199.1 nuclear transport factor 2 family protein [Pedobacter sp. MC2016-15]
METAVDNTREFLMSVIDAFDKNDVDLILSHLADDVEWTIVGEQRFSGKQSIGDFFRAFPDMKMISSTKDHIIISGNNAVVDGEVQCINEGTGVHHDMFYCDIYDFKDGKVQKMTSYTVNKKKAEPEAES